MSKHMDRAKAVKKFLTEYEDLNPEFVAKKLGCGLGQARRAIRQGRLLAADDGYLVSFATPRTGYTVAADGDPEERAASWVSQQRYVNTRMMNNARVMGAAKTRLDASPYERALSKLAKATATQAEAERIRLDAIAELIVSNGSAS